MNMSIFHNPLKFIPYKNKNFKTYIEEDIFYKLIIMGNNDEFWDVVIGKELNLSNEFKDLVIHMIAYEPEIRFTLNQIINHPWFNEINQLTNEEKNILEENVKNELIDILKIKNQYNEENYTNKNYLPDAYISNLNKSATLEQKSIFTLDFELEKIDEKNLDMKYYFKINTSLNPKKFMNELYNKLSKFKNNLEDDNRNINIIPTGESFEIDIIFNTDIKEII